MRLWRLADCVGPREGEPESSILYAGHIEPSVIVGGQSNNGLSQASRGRGGPVIGPSAPDAKSLCLNNAKTSTPDVCLPAALPSLSSCP